MTTTRQHRRRDVLPLPGQVVAALREQLSACGRVSRPGRLWPRSWYRASARMLRIDPEAAGIPYQDSDVDVFSFHALRHEFISNLARGGVHPKERDVTFGKDQCRIRKGHADVNFSILRRTALSILKNNQSLKVGMKNNRLSAGWNDDYLKEVLFGN